MYWVGYGCVHQRGKQGVRKLDAAEAGLMVGFAERRTKRGKQLVCFARLQGLQVAAIKGLWPVLRLYHRLVMRFGTSRFFIQARYLGALLPPRDLKALIYPTFHRACSGVVIALRFGTQGPGFEPGLFHKTCYMSLHGC